MAERYCVEHQQPWFKKGKMKTYAHPIKDSKGVTTGWCNEPDKVEFTPEGSKQTTTSETKVIPKPITEQEKGSITREIHRQTNEKIAEQVAVKAITELVCAGKLTENCELANALLQWCADQLSHYLPPTTQKPSESHTPSVLEHDLENERNLLYGIVMANMKYKDAKTARSWLINVQKLTAEDIDQNPKETANKLIEKMGWK